MHNPPTPAEAREILSRFNASHFKLADREHARYSIPADHSRDDDLRLGAFIDRFEELEKELADLKAEHQQLLDGAVKLKELHMTDGAMEAHIESNPEISQWVAKCFASMVQASPNYTEMRFDPAVRNGTCITVLIQKHDGKTPHELRREAETERDVLKAELAAERHAKELSNGAYSKLQAEATDLQQQLGKAWTRANDADLLHGHALKLICNHIENEKKLTAEILDTKESAARQSCCTYVQPRDYMLYKVGQKLTDSGAISSNAELLRDLAAAGRFRIVAETGRMVVGFWPENDPELQANKTTEGRP